MTSAFVCASLAIVPTAMLRFDGGQDRDDIELVGLAMLCTSLDLEAGRIDDPAANALLRQRALNPEPVIADLKADEHLTAIDAVLADKAHEIGQVATRDPVTRYLRRAFDPESHDPGAAAQLQCDKQVWYSISGHGDSPLKSCGEEAILPPREHHPHGIYIGSWLEVLREDDRAIVRAASAASKAADYLLAFRPRPDDPVDIAADEDEREAA